MSETATLTAVRKHWVGAHPGPVCGESAPGDEFTRFPRQVNCPRCLASGHPMMRAERARREHEEGDA